MKNSTKQTQSFEQRRLGEIQGEIKTKAVNCFFASRGDGGNSKHEPRPHESPISPQVCVEV